MRHGMPLRMPAGGACRRASLLSVAFAIMLAIVQSGCGKKADPVLPTVFLPPAVSELNLQRTGEGISLAWAMSAKAGNVTRFRILRSEGDMRGARGEYLLIDELAPGDGQLVQEGGGKYRYNDFTVRPGHGYAYRVQACYGPKICGAARESAEIKFD